MFRKLILLLLVSFAIQGIYAKEVYPQAINSFIEKRRACDHFRGEISGEPDIDNARNLNEQLDKYCKGTDQLLETLKLKYKDNKSVLETLNAYELIECTDNCSIDSEEVTVIKPQFSDYPITNIVANTTGKYSVNFAGHYHILTKGCGGGAICGEIIDINTGKIVAGFPNAYLIEDDGSNYFAANYQLDSSLIIIFGIAADTETDINNNVLEDIYRVRYYNFLNGKLILLEYNELSH